MRQSRAEQQEVELDAERRIKFKGTARIWLESLDFPRYGGSENVQRLKSGIEHEGCYRLEGKYHVSAIIDQDALDRAIEDSDTTYVALSSNAQEQWPFLHFPSGVRLQCLRGWDRLRAGWESLPPKDRWWTVDLYLSDLNAVLERSLRDGFSNEGKPSDGQVYRKIRQYTFQDDLVAEHQWWARLDSENKKTDLRKLLRHERYTTALDALLDIPGLWDGVRGGMWKKMIDLKCEEEVLHYLEHIRAFWSNLLQHDVHWMQRLDYVTVKALERKAPGASLNDLAYLCGKIQKGTMFHAFNEQERNTILDALKSFDGLVPSFDTFFEDFKCLQTWGSCAKMLKRVNPDKEGPGRTVFTALEQAFDKRDQHTDHCLVQTGETAFTSIPGTTVDRVDLGYRQLFLYVMRHHREMMPGSTKIEVKGRRSVMEGIRIPEQVDRLAWCGFAALAAQLGFASLEIASLTPQDEAAVQVQSERTEPSFVTAEFGESDKRRSGRPFDQAYEQSRDSLFLHNIHGADRSQGRGITPFFVRRSIYLAFLGHSPLTCQTATQASHTGAIRRPPQETRDVSMSDQDTGRGEAAQGDSARQAGSIPRVTPEEARSMVVDDTVLPQDWPVYREALLEMYNENSDRASEAPSIVGSSVYSVENVNFRGAAPTHNNDEGHVLRIADGVKVHVKFILRDGDYWVDQEDISVDPSDPSQVERVAEEHTRNRRFLFNTTLQSMASSECFEAVYNDGTNVILLIPEGSVNIDHELLLSAAKLGLNAGETRASTFY